MIYNFRKAQLFRLGRPSLDNPTDYLQTDREGNLYLKNSASTTIEYDKIFGLLFNLTQYLQEPRRNNFWDQMVVFADFNQKAKSTTASSRLGHIALEELFDLMAVKKLSDAIADKNPRMMLRLLQYTLDDHPETKKHPVIFLVDDDYATQLDEYIDDDKLFRRESYYRKHFEELQIGFITMRRKCRKNMSQGFAFKDMEDANQVRLFVEPLPRTMTDAFDTRQYRALIENCFISQK